jgi:arginyl-tRNA synthetase
MLLKWEAGDEEVKKLWKTMNGWVYEGFDKTYKALGVDFDKIYYESNTYLLGKEVIQEGLSKNVFYKKDNGSIAIDLTADGLDEKIVLRSDGTSVYITQDLGTAIERFKEFPGLEQLIYTVGNEQDYHFKVLFKILEKLGYGWAKECYHLSYGMVELPEGKMKSREGTVVDADELLQEMYDTAEATTKELGKVEGFTNAELDALYRTVSLGALKYFILKVDPKKKMMFDPKESIDFNGHTGPFIQYTYARIKSVLRKVGSDFESQLVPIEMNSIEKEIVKYMYDFDAIVSEAGKTYSPALVANYVYELTKLYNRFYHEFSILKEENVLIKQFRLQLSKASAQILSNAMMLLGIEVPERM